MVNAMTPLTTDCGRAGLQKCANTTISDLELSEASFYRVVVIFIPLGIIHQAKNEVVRALENLWVLIRNRMIRSALFVKRV